VTKTVDFSMSGTLGDSFIALCKLVGYYRRTGNHVRLHRQSSHTDFDTVISQLFNHVPYVEYVTPCTFVDPNTLQTRGRPPFVGHYINAGFSPSGRGIFPDDPPEAEFEPFPVLGPPPTALAEDRAAVGVQLNSGKWGGNYKGISLPWLRQLARALPENRYQVHLLGTGDGFRSGDITRLCETTGFHNHVGQTTFDEWLALIKAMDFFITPEGFPAFFAMSQRVPTLAVFPDSSDLWSRIHPAWRERVTVVSAGHDTLWGRLKNSTVRRVLGRDALLAPMEPSALPKLVGEPAPVRSGS